MSAAIRAKTDDILLYDNAYNIPLHIFAEARQPLLSFRPRFPFDPGKAVLVHYHYLAAERHRADFLKVLKRIRCPADVAEWVRHRCAELDWPIAGDGPDK